MYLDLWIELGEDKTEGDLFEQNPDWTKNNLRLIANEAKARGPLFINMQ